MFHKTILKNKVAITKNTFQYLGIVIPFMIIIYTFYNDLFFLKIITTYFCFLILIITINILVENKKIKLLFFIINSLIFSLFSFIDIAHYTIFNYQITGSTIYILFETNLDESKEFLKTYLNYKIILIGLFYSISSIVGILYSLKRNNFKENLNKISPLIRCTIITCSITCLLLIIQNRNYAIHYTFPKSIMKFIIEKYKLSKTKILKEGNFEEVCHTKNNEKETYVIIIGESTTRTHMGIYDYYRDTTPLLQNISNELLIFDNVRAPHVHTIASLEKTLTLGDYNIPSKKFNSTIVQLFNAANFNTYLISNQRPIGTFDTTTTLITKTSNKKIFTNLSRSTNIHDEVVLDPLHKVLNEKTDKKFILIHLMGTHTHYSNRFPSEYNIFKDKPLTKFNHIHAYNTINDYDNAILYNDYIIHSIIKKVKSTNSKSYVLYFSDHGDEVFDTKNNAGHSEKNTTPSMYNIPFILWRSDIYIKDKKIVFKKNRKYNNEHLIHTIADLSEINFSKFEKEKSIINPELLKTFK